MLPLIKNKASYPLVSVIIPTANRPHLVVRAVRSALAQTLSNIEVIVIIDGPDKKTEEALQQIRDHRLRYTMHTENRGVAAGRNTGVSLARAHWIAFLDDDDLWMPDKLSLQLSSALRSQYAYPVIASKVLAKDEAGEYVWPRRYPAAGEHLSEYLFCRKTPFWGEGLILTSAMFISRELLKKLPFTEGMRINSDDIDWLLRAYAQEHITVEFVETHTPLVIWHIEVDRSRLSYHKNWQDALKWIQSMKSYVTKEAYSAYVLGWIGLMAVRAADWRACYILTKEAFRHGSPSWNDIVYYAGLWLLPSSLRQWLALRYARLSRNAFRKKGEKHA